MTVNEIWTSHNFLSKTRIIVTTGPEFSAIPHPTPWNTHTTHLLVTLHSSAPTCFSLGEASCSWKQHILWSLSCRQTLQPFQKSTMAFYVGKTHTNESSEKSSSWMFSSRHIEACVASFPPSHFSLLLLLWNFVSRKSSSCLSALSWGPTQCVFSPLKATGHICDAAVRP